MAKSKKEIARERRNDRTNNWLKKNVKQIKVSFMISNEEDMEAFTYAKLQENIKAYIKSLILEDKKKHENDD